MSTNPVAAERTLEPFRLGEWTVYPARNQLVREGEQHHLEARTMDVLVSLSVHPGEVVTKDGLIDAVWEGRIIAEGTLTNAVAELRRALGDDARAPRYIETIPKRGYRLLVPVVTGPQSGLIAATRVSRRARNRWLALGAGLLLALAATGAFVIAHRAPVLAPDRVLILPPANRTGDPGNAQITLLARDRMAQGAVDAGLGRITVGAGPAATQEVAVHMGREHGAGLVVIGSVYLRDGSLELETQLVDTAAGELLYAVPPVEVKGGETAAAVADLSDRTLGAVATHLRAHAHSRLLSHAPTFAAYREFMAGSEHFGTDYGKSIIHLRRAVEIDPDYTSAWLRLAVAYRHVGRYEQSENIFSRLDARRQQLTPFERLTLDLLGKGITFPEQAYAAAREIQRMVPDDAIFRFLGGGLALQLNRPREALDWLGAAPKKVPSYVARNVTMASEHWLRATALHMVGEYTLELAAAKEGVRRYPGMMVLRGAEARALATVGNAGGVESAISEALATPPRQGSAGWVMLDGAAAARAHGHPILGEQLAKQAGTWFERVKEGQGGVNFGLAEAAFQRGQLPLARQVLEEGLGHLSEGPSYLLVAAWGWLGVVAVRQGDESRASEVDVRLAAVNKPWLRGHALFYRAAIAAWRGRHRTAAERFREARAAGWGVFVALHDRERILLEPVGGDPVFSAVLRPVR